MEQAHILGWRKGTLTGLSVKYFLAQFPDGIEVMEGGYHEKFRRIIYYTDIWFDVLILLIFPLIPNGV